MRNSIKKWILFLVISLPAIALDILTKKLAIVHLKDKEAIVLLKNIFELTYVENRGAAFGILQGGRVIFFIITFVVILGILYGIYKLPTTGRYMPLLTTLSFVFAGAIGNFIDRLLQGYVVDFLYFSLIDFPVFNVADIYVTCSVIVLAWLSIFYYEEKELEFFR